MSAPAEVRAPRPSTERKRQELDAFRRCERVIRFHYLCLPSAGCEGFSFSAIAPTPLLALKVLSAEHPYASSVTYDGATEHPCPPLGRRTIESDLAAAASEARNG